MGIGAHGSDKKPILLLDFDGVIHQYLSPWTKAYEVSDDPVPGVGTFIIDASKHFDVCVYSARTTQGGGIQAMKNWMIKNGLPFDLVRFPTEKPPAFLTLDDRCVCFDGIFPNPDELLNFRPWNRKG